MRRLLCAVKKYSPTRLRADRALSREYSDSIAGLKTRHAVTDKKIAVVIHLFYLENWPLFKQKLRTLKGVTEFDLYITLPKQNIHFIDTIREEFPAVEYMIAPNRGRDVLPFIQISRVLMEWHYESVLKFHSKKSSHWEGGQSWLEHTLAQIIPEDTRILSDIVNKISLPTTGVIGPAEYYYPLTVNFPANGMHLSKFVGKTYGMAAERKYLQENRGDYGFFGGTMFWMRLDAVGKIIRQSRLSMFELEQGQVDGTYAHAVERLLTLVPEIENKVNYECDSQHISERPYRSANIPEWSQDHDK